MSFSSLGLSEALVRATSDQGYETPSPIQAQAIPYVLDGRDVLGRPVYIERTGSAKFADLVKKLGHDGFVKMHLRAMEYQSRVLLPAASADAVSPPRTPKAKGKLLAPQTATGPSGTLICFNERRGCGEASGSPG